MSLLGLDLSKYQLYDTSPPDAFDFDAAESMGAWFIIQRLSKTNADGSLYTDFRLFDYWNHNEALPVLALYSYVRLNFDVMKQADHFLEVYKSLPARSLTPLEIQLGISQTATRPVIDLEGDPPWNVSKENAAVRLKTWLHHVENELGIVPIIYTRAEWFDSFVAADSEWQNYPLWIARYPGIDNAYKPVIPGPWADGNYAPLNWKFWTLWQYTNFGNGLVFGAQSKQIDLNLFNGTTDEFAAFLEGSQLLPVPRGDLLVLVDDLNVRRGPGLNYPVVDQLHAGDFETLHDLSGFNTWGKIGESRWIAIHWLGRKFVQFINGNKNG